MRRRDARQRESAAAFKMGHFTGRATSRCCCSGSVISNFSIHSLTALSASVALMRPRMAAGVPLMREISQLLDRRPVTDFVIVEFPHERVGVDGCSVSHVVPRLRHGEQRRPGNRIGHVASDGDTIRRELSEFVGTVGHVPHAKP
jgi:hypothetical protein